jgi:hypothetical protein
MPRCSSTVYTSLQKAVYLAFGVLATACIDPPPATKTVTNVVELNAERCAVDIPATEVFLNDKISWTLQADSPGYLGVEEFNVSFAATNPTYCVDLIRAKKNKTITCTVKSDATTGGVDYGFVTYFEGGSQSCSKDFLLEIKDYAAEP